MDWRWWSDGGVQHLQEHHGVRGCFNTYWIELQLEFGVHWHEGKDEIKMKCVLYTIPTKLQSY